LHLSPEGANKEESDGENSTEEQQGEDENFKNVADSLSRKLYPSTLNKKITNLDPIQEDVDTSLMRTKIQDLCS